MFRNIGKNLTGSLPRRASDGKLRRRRPRPKTTPAPPSRTTPAGPVEQTAERTSRADRNGRLSRWKRSPNNKRRQQRHKVTGYNSKKKSNNKSNNKNTKRRRYKKRRRNKNKNKTKRKKIIDPRIVGILDRRVPTEFRQSPFITISLASFVVLSTGVTNLIPQG